MSGTLIVGAGQPSQAEAEFQQKMQDRMRAAMGDLMPDAILAEIVKRGVEDAFFKRRERAKRYVSDHAEFDPPWLVEFLQKEIKGRVEEAVKVWIAANPERIAGQIDAHLGQGVAHAITLSFAQLFDRPIQNLRDEMQEAFRRAANR